jgi:hypothetical protein
MDETTDWKRRGWQALSLGTLLLAAPGCDSPSTPSPQLKIQAAPEPPKETVPTDRTAPGFIGQFLQNLSNGETDPDLFTVAFKKKIARPRYKNDEDDGYYKDKFDAFLRKIGRADKNSDGDKIGGGEQYQTRFVLVDAAEGPYALGEVKTKGGRTEGYLMHIIPADNPSGWQIDWFQRSPVFISYVADNLKPDMVGAELAVHRFMENLLGGEELLAEATLSRAWKLKPEYASTLKPDADLGYNQPLIVQKLREWKGAYPEYAIVERSIAAGKPAFFEIRALDAQHNPLKQFDLTVKKEPTGEWVVDNIDVK